ncbi:MAG: cupin domain-containing protein [Betaproteobacteria bacterium]
MQIIRAGEAALLANSGVTSQQLIFPENSPSARVTITRVTMAPGARNPPHRHAASEQIWVALRGNGSLLLEHDATLEFAAGDVARFEHNELHGFQNGADAQFEYLSVTSPPVNFRGAYANEWK